MDFGREAPQCPGHFAGSTADRQGHRGRTGAGPDDGRPAGRNRPPAGKPCCVARHLWRGGRPRGPMAHRPPLCVYRSGHARTPSDARSSRGEPADRHPPRAWPARGQRNADGLAGRGCHGVDRTVRCASYFARRAWLAPGADTARRRVGRLHCPDRTGRRPPCQRAESARGLRRRQQHPLIQPGIIRSERDRSRALRAMRRPARLETPQWLALAWLLVVVALGWHQWRFWQAPRLDTDVSALLPQDERASIVQRATRQLGEQGERRVVVTLGATEWRVAQMAASAFDQSLTAAHAGLRRAGDGAVAAQALDFYRPWRDALLTDAQRAALRAADVQALVAQALERVHGLNTGQPTAWLADPLNLWPTWWSQREGLTAARPRDGLLWVADGQRDWAVLLYDIEGPAFRFDGTRRWGDALDEAGRMARICVAADGACAPITVLRAGVPVHAEAGAAQGSREMNTIGWGSLAAVIALGWWAFRALRPVVLIVLSLVIGWAAALAAPGRGAGPG